MAKQLRGNYLLNDFQKKFSSYNKYQNNERNCKLDEYSHC